MPRSPLILMVMALAACAPAAAPGPVAAPGAPVSTLILRSATTATGQPLRLPQGPVEVVASATVLPAGGVIPMHRHPWPRIVYVESGRIAVAYGDGRPGREFGPGDVLVEAIDTWHEGRVVGASAARLIVIDQVPPGEVNVVRRD